MAVGESDETGSAALEPKGLRSLGRTNLTEDVPQELARGLSTGRLLPGSRLGIRDLAEEMGISPTPVREALQQLVAEGALSQIAGRSFRVPELGPEDYLELRNLRVMLEGEAAALTSLRITPETIEHLEAVHARLADAKQRADFKSALIHNQEFHLRVCAESGSPRLYRIVDGLWLQMGPLMNVLYTRSSVPTDESKRHWHLQLLDAFRARDPEAARSALQSDITGGSEEILTALKLRQQSAARKKR